MVKNLIFGYAINLANNKDLWNNTKDKDEYFLFYLKSWLR